jgi:hypothetical protein
MRVSITDQGLLHKTVQINLRSHEYHIWLDSDHRPRFCHTNHRATKYVRIYRNGGLVRQIGREGGIYQLHGYYRTFGRYDVEIRY